MAGHTRLTNVPAIFMAGHTRLTNVPAIFMAGHTRLTNVPAQAFILLNYSRFLSDFFTSIVVGIKRSLSGFYEH